MWGPVLGSGNAYLMISIGRNIGDGQSRAASAKIPLVQGGCNIPNNSQPAVYATVMPANNSICHSVRNGLIGVPNGARRLLCRCDDFHRGEPTFA